MDDNANGSFNGMDFSYIYGEDVWGQYADVTVRIERIYPETAARMLEANVGNRTPKREALVTAIEEGEWVLNGETIIFSRTGRLIDGQNRLIACVKAGKPIDTVVVRGVDDGVQVTVDGGVKRQVADFLKMMGYKEANAVGAMGTALFRADNFGVKAVFNKPNGSSHTTKQVVDYVVENYDARIKPLVRPCRKVVTRYRGINIGTLACLFDVFKSVDIESYTTFVGMLANEYQPTKTMMLLQNKLEENSRQKQGRLPQLIIAALVVKTWNAYMLGEDKTLLKFTAGGAHPEAFPEIFTGWE